ncbi:hypothetical protein [Phreatobacter sp.]|uniref:hypothetical protein n=1 Tax=Phreatobacter sp. TaxID=1966341 RepID=UPI003F720E12
MAKLATSSGFFRTVDQKTASFCLALVATLTLAAGLACLSRPIATASTAAPILVPAAADHAAIVTGRSAHKLTRSPIRIFGNPALRPAEAGVVVARA